MRHDADVTAPPTPTPATTTTTTDDMWARVVGQPTAVESLVGAARQPVHAYLLVGQPGWGSSLAARVFAAELVSDGLPAEDAARARQLTIEDQHPDVEVFVPEGAYLSVEGADEITRSASLSPVEGSRKVLILTEFHKVREAGPKLLKTIEEPSASTVFVILADEVPDELVTIASRAVRVDFHPIAVAVLTDELAVEGVDPEVARAAALASGGDLERARVLVSDERLALRWEAWRTTPMRLTGDGTSAWQASRELLGHIDDAQVSIDAAHKRQTEALSEQIETYGQRPTALRALADRQKREVRRHRTDELRFGLAAMASTYRDRLATVDDPVPLLDAIDHIGDAAEALVRNPNETLLLQALLANLPPLAR